VLVLEPEEVLVLELVLALALVLVLGFGVQVVLMQVFVLHSLHFLLLFGVPEFCQ
jgi:hypothetical protein